MHKIIPGSTEPGILFYIEHFKFRFIEQLLDK